MIHPFADGSSAPSKKKPRKKVNKKPSDKPANGDFNREEHDRFITDKAQIFGDGRHQISKRVFIEEGRVDLFEIFAFAHQIV